MDPRAAIVGADSKPSTTLSVHSTPMASEITSITKDERRMVYKGKATHRSWPQLPEEVIRYALDVAAVPGGS